MADSGNIEGGPRDGRADAQDGSVADAPSDAGTACPQSFFDLDDFNPDVAHTLVVRLDAELQILDFVHLMSEPCRYGDCLSGRTCSSFCYVGRPSEEHARETVGEVVDLSADAELLREHDGDVYVFLDVPDPDGQVAVLTAATPFQVAFASTLSTGSDMLQWPPPEEWRDPQTLGLDCEPTDDEARRGYDLADGSELEPEVVQPVFDVVTATGAWRFFRDWFGWEGWLVLRSPRSMPTDGSTPSASWIVILTGYANVEA